MRRPAVVSPWTGNPDHLGFLDVNRNARSSEFPTNETLSSTLPPQVPLGDTCLLSTPFSHSTQGMKDKPLPRVTFSSTHQTSIRPPLPVEYPHVTKLSESWMTRSQKPTNVCDLHQTPRCPCLGFNCSPNDPPPSYRSGYSTPNTRSSTPIGLGLEDSQFQATPTLEPSTNRRSKRESTTNVAQRIEGKLWHYSAHGNIFKKWLLEIISWCISAACMATIIIVLLVFKDKRPNDWPLQKSGLSLNVFMATLSRLSSAALLLPVSEAIGQLKWIWFFQGPSKKMWDFEIFDNASRGPWGSFQLLVRTKGQRLAALGAAIVLLALALDPFFQPVLDFPIRWTEYGSGTISRVVRYAPTYNQIYVGGKLQPIQDIIVQTAANNFFFANGTQAMQLGNGTASRPEIPLSCPTSNCTWPDYQTLGFCSECADLSDQLEFACLNTRLDWLPTLNSTFDEWIYPNGSVCGHFLNATSDLPVMMSGYLVKESTESEDQALTTRILPSLSMGLKKPIYDGSIHFKDQLAPVLDFFIATSKDGAAGVYRNETPVALECVISWCVKTMRSTYYEGRYKEEILHTFVNRSEARFPFETSLNRSTGVVTMQYMFNITLRPWEEKEEEEKGEKEEKGEENNDKDDDGDEKEEQETRPVYGGNHTEFTNTGDAAFAVIRVFDELFPSFITVANHSSKPVQRRQLNVRGFARTSTIDWSPWTAPNNITNHVQKMCTAMTNGIRSSKSSVNIPGTAYITESFVAVRWVWLSLPLALLAFSFVFLGATMIKTAHQQGHVGVWKTSGIAALLNGLPDDMQKQMAAAKGTPRTQAREMKVKLLPKMGWRVSVSEQYVSSTTSETKHARAPPGWI